MKEYVGRWNFEQSRGQIAGRIAPSELTFVTSSKGECQLFWDFQTARYGLPIFLKSDEKDYASEFV
jgi:hypothetical protein